MLLVLDSILFAFITVIVRHVEPEGMIENTHAHTQTGQDDEQVQDTCTVIHTVSVISGIFTFVL